VYGRGKSLIIVLFHPKLLLPFKNAEEGLIYGLKNVCYMQSECDKFDMVFVQKTDDLTGDMSTPIVHHRNSVGSRAAPNRAH
jgi:hypothetical protein